MRAVVVGSLVAVCVGLLGVSPAWGAYGDEFGVAPINGHPEAFQDAPAFPGDDAFWAGTCDRSDAPAPPPVGDPPAAIPGGVGGIGAQVWAPSAGGGSRVQVDAPAVPEHCVDQGSVALWSGVPDPWAIAPGWRLPAVTEAGAHPDGTTTMQFRRQSGGGFAQVDGSVDNIYVDLPPGFVGNPNAVPKCTAEQFAVKPLACPPESQVGVLRLTIHAVFADGNLPEMNERVYPVYNLEPRKGRVAEFGFGYVVAEYTTVRLVAKARTNGDFGVTALVGQIPSTLPPVGQSITLWGVPWEPSNDIWRAPPGLAESSGCRDQPGGGSGYIPWSGLSEACRTSYDPSWGPVKPFLSNETDCNPSPVARLATDSYQNPGAFTGERDPDLPPFPALAGPDSNWETYSSLSPAVTGCETLGFDPDLELDPSSRSADGASGLRAELAVPQNNEPRTAAGGPLDPPPAGAAQAAVDDYLAAATGYWDSPAGRATAHLKDTVVTLPAGVSVNPSAAAGLQACSDAGIGLREGGSPPRFNNGDPFNKDGGADGAECPDGSKIGSARVNTPLLEEPLEGEVVLGQPRSTDPQSGEMFRLFIVVRAPDRGLIAKIYGSSTANGTVGEGGSGQIVTRFLNNPEVPFDDLSLDIKGGQRGLLALPERCGAHGWASSMLAWSAVGAPVTVPAADDGGNFAVNTGCEFGFWPGLEAGMSDKQARASGTFSFEFTRNGGEQRFGGLTAQLPEGLLAAVRDVPLCTGAQASAGACPAGSRIGWVDGAAGSGVPFVLEQKGEVYLTEGYKGAPYGLMVRVPVVAGPFRGAAALSPIVIRQALHVDRTTAQVTAISDPLPQVWHGIPLRIREVTAVVDRPQFMLNPSDCAPKPIGAKLTSTAGTVAIPQRRFQATGCKALEFKPKLGLRLVGRRQRTTGKHPAVRAQVTQKQGEAGIRKAVVRLPKSLALDPDNAQALCEFEDGTKPDLENHCPDGSIVGRARAISPLLKQPLAGDVYFVKNIRIDPDTGNEIRTLPMIVAALRGEIAINLTGESSVTQGGKLVNTFDQVPDAPINRFNLNIQGGRNGILTVTRTRRSTINLCKTRRTTARANLDGHNGAHHTPDIRIQTPCPTKRNARLKIGKANRTANKVLVTGRISPTARAKKLAIVLRCKGTKVARTVKPNRRGYFKRTLPARACATGKARVIARYPGNPHTRTTKTAKRVTRG